MSAKWHLAQWLELQWWKHYLRPKNPAEYVEWKRSYWKKFFENFESELTVSPNSSIAEFGCGPAGCFIHFTENKMLCLDPLIEKYEETFPHFSKLDYPNVQFIAKPAEEFDPKEKFDVVLCLNALNHFRNMDVALEVMRNCTAEDGRFLLSVDVHKSAVMKWLFRLVPGDALHPHQCDTNDYLKLLEQHGFKTVAVKKLKSGNIFDYVAIVAIA